MPATMTATVNVANLQEVEEWRIKVSEAQRAIGAAISDLHAVLDSAPQLVFELNPTHHNHEETSNA